MDDLQANDILGEEIPELPKTVGDFRKHSVSSVMWKMALTKIRARRFSSIVESIELAPTLSEALNCKS